MGARERGSDLQRDQGNAKVTGVREPAPKARRLAVLRALIHETPGGGKSATRSAGARMFPRGRYQGLRRHPVQLRHPRLLPTPSEDGRRGSRPETAFCSRERPYSDPEPILGEGQLDRGNSGSRIRLFKALRRILVPDATPQVVARRASSGTTRGGIKRPPTSRSLAAPNDRRSALPSWNLERAGRLCQTGSHFQLFQAVAAIFGSLCCSRRTRPDAARNAGTRGDGATRADPALTMAKTTPVSVI